MFEKLKEDGISNEERTILTIFERVIFEGGRDGPPTSPAKKNTATTMVDTDKAEASVPDPFTAAAIEID